MHTEGMGAYLVQQIQDLTKQLAPNCNQTKMTINPRAGKCRKQSTYLPETQQIGSLHDDDDDDDEGEQMKER